MRLFGKKSEVKDPVCGMAVDPQKVAATSTHMGTTYYFCSRTCKEEFEKQPMQYMPSGARTEHGGKSHGCC